MPISRALLNRLRLPYKALEIQGSKGDVLYIPDDVGVDLSVMHGVHNGDMVPVKTDSDGIVSITNDIGSENSKGKYHLIVATELPVDTSETSILVDTSKASNYAVYFRIRTTSNPSVDFHVLIVSMMHNFRYNNLGSFSLQATVDNKARLFLLPNSNILTTDITELQCSIQGGSGSVTVDIDMIGWN